ncbi:MAG: FtsH protease activity modulator HflK [Proteobacteria bacterium]|nr:FtsH protease activity modulator HflK [Pseudomonadota bacterium]
MAWNQPNGGQNNPWGRRPGQGGGDLDERLKSWQRWLESHLRFGGDGSGSLWFIGALALLVVWLSTGIYQVGKPESAVVQRFGRLVDVKPPNSGLCYHLPWPIESVNKVNVGQVNSSTFSGRVLTSDLNLIELGFAVHFQLTDPRKVLFSINDPAQTLSEVSESAIRETIGRSTLAEVQSGQMRPEITRRTRDLIQHTLDSYNSGITVTTVSLEKVQVPDAVVPSRNDADKARDDKDRYIAEADAYANKIIPTAQGTATRVQQDAEAYKAQVTALAEGQAALFTQIEAAYAAAPEVTRRRMYMDTMETVLARAHKVLIDGKAGSNMIYLPIDKLLEKGVHEAEVVPSESAAPPAAGKEPEPAGTEPRGRSER